MKEPRPVENGGARLDLVEVLLIAVIVATLAFLVVRIKNHSPAPNSGLDAQNARQVALAALIYAGDYNDGLPPTMNGPLSRLQNRSDKDLTINSPGLGTQDLPSLDAAGGRPTRTWVNLISPYTKSLQIFVDPNRGDPHGYFKRNPLSVGDRAYDPNGATWRNQGRFPDYGYNYMFLAPLRIPADKLQDLNAVNYAISLPLKTEEIDDPSGTIFLADSQRGIDDPNSGFFVVNAPAMWSFFANNAKGYVAFWRGSPGSGDWSGVNPACKDSDDGCPDPTLWHGFVALEFRSDANFVMTDGHVQFMNVIEASSGTNIKEASQKGVLPKLIDKVHYLWNATDNYYGQDK